MEGHLERRDMLKLKKEPEVELVINWYPKVLVQHYAHLVILFRINASCTWENPTHVAKSCHKGLCRAECSSSVCWCLWEPPGWEHGITQDWEQLSLLSLQKDLTALGQPLLHLCHCKQSSGILGRGAAPSCAHFSSAWTAVLHKAALPSVEFHLFHCSQCKQRGRERWY